MKKRDSFIFYRSFYEALKDLPEKERLEVYEAIATFSLEHKEIKLSGVSKTIFTLVKPQLEANYKRYQNGSKPKAKRKQTKSKVEANKNVNVNDNENQNVKMEFDVFWSQYDYNQELKKCQSEWMRLTQEDKNLIFKHLPKYIQSTPDKKYRLKPYNYLIQEKYRDEVILPDQEETKIDPLVLKMCTIDDYVMQETCKKRGLTPEQVLELYNASK